MILGFLCPISNADIFRTRPPIRIPKTPSSSEGKVDIIKCHQKSALTHRTEVNAKTGSSRRSAITREPGRVRARELHRRTELEQRKRTRPLPTPRRLIRSARASLKFVNSRLSSSNAGIVKPEELPAVPTRRGYHLEMFGS